MTTTTKVEVSVWCAWRRRIGGRWEQVATGATEAEAFRKLCNYLRDPATGSGDSICLPRGRKPARPDNHAD